MLPMIFTPAVPTLLWGRGPAFGKRLSLLRGAGLMDLAASATRPTGAELDKARLVFGAGLDADEGEWLAAEARGRRVPVNIEDVPHLCDVHVPALVRRGALLLTASTGGGAPALASALREWLAGAFGEEWADHLAALAARRQALREAGASFAEVNRVLRASLPPLPRL